MKYPWPAIIAELRRTPGRWRLLPEMIGRPITLISRIRRRSARALRLDDGKIYARRGHLAHRDEGAITDVWLRFVPNEEEDT